MKQRMSVKSLLALSLVVSTALADSLVAQQPPTQAATPPAQQAGRGTITGTVKDNETGIGLSQVSVIVVGTAFGATTGTDGRYTIANVPNGIYAVEAKRLGYSPNNKANIRVAGAPLTLDFALLRSALTLTSVMSTGLTDPASGARTPFSVAQVSGEKLTVTPVGSPLEILAGKVAGLSVRGGTMPGSDVVLQIRNPLSITGYTQPMIIVDGVIQMQDDPTIDARSITGNPLDIDPEMIESIEVVRGAAAAALYGQRAANGVINITTKRGTDAGVGTTRLTVSSDVGLSQLGRYLKEPKHHAYRVNEQNQFIDAFGRPVEGRTTAQLAAAVQSFSFMDNVYGVPVYDNVRALYGTGSSMRNNLSLGQSGLSTNFQVSAGTSNETGILVIESGTSRQNLGINLDYRAGNNMTMGLGMAYTKSFTRQLTTIGSLLLNTQDMAKTVNIREVDPATGQPFLFPDGTALPNPLFIEPNRDEWDRRMGAQANANVTMRPSSVISFTLTGGYQRQDGDEQLIWEPVGLILTDGSAASGQYGIAQSMNETYNTRARASLLKGFGGWTVRGAVQTGGQLQLRNAIDIEGDTLTHNTRSFENIRRITDVGHNVRDVRNLDWSGSVALDYNQKYILDVVYRADGNSLLPENTRWQNNGRASFAYSMSDEAWWPLADFTLFKPRYSIGTAGNNPPLAARYELYSRPGSSDRVAKQNLGNINIVPEEVTEQELGIDIAYRNRYSISLNYVTNTVKNLIRPDTILAFTGFETQQSNLGDLKGYTYEATIEANWIQRRNTRFASTLVLDRGRQKIANYPRRCNDTEIAVQLNRFCEGYVFGQQYGYFLVRRPEDLNPIHTTRGSLDQFDVNDEGLLVAVGPGGKWTDSRWGQTVDIDGVRYGWGMPIRASTYNPLTGARVGDREKIIGMGIPDFSLGLNNQVQWKNFTFSTQFVGQVGGTIWNSARQGEMNRSVAAEMDQYGKPEHMKKPIEYYILDKQTNNGGGNWGGLTQNVRNRPVDRFIEDGTFVRLSELRLQYRFNEGLPILNRLGMTGGSVAVVSRDLFTITNYSGYDPEVAGNTAFTSARTDDPGTLPPFRNIAVNIRLTF